MGTRYSSSITDNGVDWLTLTTRTFEPAYKPLLEVADKLFEATAKEGAKGVPISPNGFEGIGNGHVFRGHRQEWLMVRFSGAVANQAITELARYESKPRCTRIDYQTTAKYTQTPEATAARVKDQIRRYERKRGLAKRCPITFYEEAQADSGFSLGDRASESVIRVYNPKMKHGDSYHPAEWRFECEWKGERARNVFSTLISSDNMNYEGRKLLIGELQRKGIEEDWFDALGVVPRGRGATDNNLEKKISWIEFTVEPVVRRLMEHPQFRLRVVNWFEKIREETADSCRNARF